LILETVGSLLAGAIGASLGWVALEFVARPIRKFYDLRGETIRRVAQYANLRAPYNERHLANGVIETSEDHTLSNTELAKLEEAREELRDLAAQMRGLAYNETIAGHALRLLGYDPRKASEGLVGIANTVDTTGDNRIRNKKIVTEALRLPEHTL
jgi:hypothetical protein